VEAAATRFRLAQFVGPLSGHGIDLSLSPFLEGEQFRSFYGGGGLLRKAFGMLPPLFKRTLEIFDARKYDLIIVQREAMFFGPAIFEWLFPKIGKCPLVLDLDDATYVSYVSPSYGKAGSFFKFFGKTNKLIERSDLVICGNRFIAEYARKKGAETIVIPTIADTGKFCPAEKDNDIPVVGWIGTHSTFPFLESLFPVLERLASKHNFILKVVGAGKEDVSIPGVNTTSLEWNLDREVADFQSLDIGLYPVVISDSANSEWLMGKSGFKAIQYMAVGIPFVMSPVGVCAEIGEADSTHFNAATDEDWCNSLDNLLSNGELRKQMGEKGREHSLKYYSVSVHAETLARALEAVSIRGRRDDR
jgi:glycosyltransferase involved in cell wall biosynthesis